MKNFDNIKTGFSKAKLNVVRSSRPRGFGVGARDTFFCEIVKSKGKPVFSIWPGAETNEVLILDTDPSFKQLVLMVKEQARIIQMNEWDSIQRKVVKRSIKVPAGRRKFLLGFDERDLFMAQLPVSRPITTVRQAHDALRNPSLPKEKKIKTVRQGEWFFRPVNKDEMQMIECNKDFIKHKARIGKDSRGKPHTAEEYLELSSGNVESVFMFARGSVRHLDHASINLKTWHRIYPNTEDRTVNARWID